MTNAIILAAGKGDRLRPLTNEIPKCLVEFAGKSLLERQIENYKKCEIENIIIVTGYLGNKISIKGISLLENKKYETTNMVETLFCAEDEIKDSVIVSYADIIFEVDILKKIINSKEDISIIVDKNWKSLWKKRFKNPLNDAESMRIDSSGYIKDIGQPVNNINEINGQYIGLMKFQNNGIELIKKMYHKFKNESNLGINPLNPKLKFEESYLTDFLQALIKNEIKLKAIPIFGGWIEIDSMEDYNLYQKMYKEKSLSEFINI